jgi:hypothetical protein
MRTPHGFPQLPQLLPSLARSTHELPQSVIPGAQASLTHAPDVHF